MQPPADPAIKVQIYAATANGAFAEKIAVALDSQGVEIVNGEFDPSTSDVVIVVWSGVALGSQRLIEAARAPLKAGALVPVSIGKVEPPDVFKRLPPMDLAGWNGDVEDPRWRFVYDEVVHIVGAARQRATETAPAPTESLPTAPTPPPAAKRVADPAPPPTASAPKTIRSPDEPLTAPAAVAPAATTPSSTEGLEPAPTNITPPVESAPTLAPEDHEDEDQTAVPPTPPVRGPTAPLLISFGVAAAIILGGFGALIAARNGAFEGAGETAAVVEPDSNEAPPPQRESRAIPAEPTGAERQAEAPPILAAIEPLESAPTELSVDESQEEASEASSALEDAEDELAALDAAEAEQAAGTLADAYAGAAPSLSPAAKERAMVITENDQPADEKPAEASVEEEPAQAAPLVVADNAAAPTQPPPVTTPITPSGEPSDDIASLIEENGSETGPETLNSAQLTQLIEKTAQPEPTPTSREDYLGDFFKDCANCPEMAAIEAGDFVMGSPAGERAREESEGPRVAMTIASRFALGTREVTFDQWDACVDAGGCRGYNPADPWERGRQPVVNVSFEDAQAYARWLSGKTGHTYRLPTEAEWEYAARGGADTPFSFGPTVAPTQANFDGSLRYGAAKGLNRQRTTPVGTFAPNAYGLFDMHGNVWEWTSDCWTASHAGMPTDGSARSDGDCTRRTLKGGAWNSGGWRLRAAHRIAKKADVREYDNGFRVLRELP